MAEETTVPDPRRPRRRLRLRDLPWLPLYAASWLAVRLILWLATDGTL